MKQAEPKFISLAEAATIAGRKSASTMAQWVKDWNYKNLDHLILRIPGRVDEITLRAALRVLAERHTPGMEVRKALATRRPLVATHQGKRH